MSSDNEDKDVDWDDLETLTTLDGCELFSHFNFLFLEVSSKDIGSFVLKCSWPSAIDCNVGHFLIFS